MIEVPWGIRTTAVPPLFDSANDIVDDRSASVARAGDTLTVRATSEPWSYLVRWPRLPSDTSPPQPVFAWVTRVYATLTAGSATLACLVDDLTRVTSEVTLTRDAPYADLLVGDVGTAAWLVLRQGSVSDAEGTSVSIRGLESAALLDEPALSRVPAPARGLSCMPRWSRFYGAVADDLATQIRYSLFARLREPAWVPWLEGLQVSMAPGEQISQAVLVSGLYEPCTSLVLRRLLRPGATFIDVGAHVGLFSMLGSRWVGPTGRVLSVEPSRRECDRLRQHVAHNGLANVRVFQSAAGDRDGEAVLHIADARHSGLNTLKSRFVYPHITEEHGEHVPVARLDSLVAQDGDPDVDVIKIDVEGAECEVLMGARRVLQRNTPAVILEVAGEAAMPAHEGREAIEGLLCSLGYAFAGIDGEAATVRRVDHLTGTMENFVAASPRVIDDLLTMEREPSAR